mmetsp:Transcript_19608/g.30214  ORF Transcript_19608/g.30214 Transcript_19608/m.30214 type:complete len:91 (-) Transcript_19608:964-1236(-)
MRYLNSMSPVAGQQPDVNIKNIFPGSDLHITEAGDSPSPEDISAKLRMLQKPAMFEQSADMLNSSQKSGALNTKYRSNRGGGIDSIRCSF